MDPSYCASVTIVNCDLEDTDILEGGLIRIEILIKPVRQPLLIRDYLVKQASRKLIILKNRYS